MKVFFDVNQSILEALFESYSKNAKLLISKISQDKNLSQFDRFDKRFNITWGMKIEFNDNLRITKEDTRACYMLMLKISDLWFAFEHLVKTASEVIPKDTNFHSKVDFYQESTLEALGFNPITSNFNQLMYGKVLHREAWRREVYHLLAYLKNNTTGGTQKLIEAAIILIKDNNALQAKHIFSIAYGIRNIYVHEGVSAALGSRNYQVKRALYLVVYDILVLYSLALADSYCCKKLINYSAIRH
ncbi:hypothetical protein ACF3DV_25305 [Chlorogloeopsis fritschii PCC 9212]|uniref:Apea-like HEPN domain-containing protein n=1 Tax=Chlorogloeopsis fritschii PCC 6912 TaxID=211165 RepID=A0A3S0ZNC4_CHLFR|nr:hypothetical protein [Chlorogloeopsis fritschii]RUR73935.1 hypothetical protein PCC6912_54760 [Chlorogloeopsis fritschii PCC 6912]